MFSKLFVSLLFILLTASSAQPIALAIAKTPPPVSVIISEVSVVPTKSLACHNVLTEFQAKMKNCSLIRFPSGNNRTLLNEQYHAVCKSLPACISFLETGGELIGNLCGDSVKSETGPLLKQVLDSLKPALKPLAAYCSKNAQGDFCFLDVMTKQNAVADNDDDDTIEPGRLLYADLKDSVCDPCFSAGIRSLTSGENAKKMVSVISSLCSVNALTGQSCFAEVVNFTVKASQNGVALSLPADFSERSAAYCKNPCWKKVISNKDYQLSDIFTRLCQSDSSGPCSRMFDPSKGVIPACFSMYGLRRTDGERGKGDFPPKCLTNCAGAFKEATKNSSCCLVTALRAIGIPTDGPAFQGFVLRCVGNDTTISNATCPLPVASKINKIYRFANIDFKRYAAKKLDIDEALKKDIAINFNLPVEHVKITETREGSLIVTTELSAPTELDATLISKTSSQTLSFSNTQEAAVQTGAVVDSKSGMTAEEMEMKESASLSVGAIVGIAFAVVIIVVVVGVVIALLTRESDRGAYKPVWS